MQTRLPAMMSGGRYYYEAEDLSCEQKIFGWRLTTRD